MLYGIAFSRDAQRFYPVSHNIPYEAIKEAMARYQQDLNNRKIGGLLISYVHILEHPDDPADCDACVSAIEEFVEREKERHGGKTLDPTTNPPPKP